MRFPKLLAAAAAIGLAAFPASAQDEAPSDPSSGLSDLESTVNELLEEETSPAGAAEAPAAEPAQPGNALSEADEPTRPAEPEADAEPVEPARPAGRTAPQAPSSPAPTLTRAEQAAVERAAERGRLLIAIARAGILATQDMLTRISDPEGAGITGWIAEPQGNAMDVTFYAAGTDGEAPSAVFRATVNGGRVVSRDIFLGDDRPALNPVQVRMAAARAATEGLDHSACTAQPFNVLVVPPASADAPIDVYQTSAPERRGSFPLGGHFRSTVAPDGTIVETRGFTNSCVDVELPPAAAGAPAPPVGVTHLLDPMPTEIHIFLAQLIGRPLLVATGEPQRVWLVTGERIAEVRP
ncbi:hypothetical protein [Sphingosinicella sp. CPCC 101087]|uniref:hypothetical protein n=1 Tax=Sphingosinicella sp. CPCC 101087 TaxID=2497754 RepID=UPI00101DFADC|nr:hypothetical protein [Sphingosinicella sp. CPCC 101087]